MPRQEHTEARRVAEQVERSDSVTRTLADRMTQELSMTRTLSRAEVIQVGRLLNTQVQAITAGNDTSIPVTVGMMMEMLVDSIEAVTLEMNMDTDLSLIHI